MRRITLEELESRYHRIRMAVFSPEYLMDHTLWNDKDFDELIDEIIRLQSLTPSK